MGGRGEGGGGAGHDVGGQPRPIVGRETRATSIQPVLEAYSNFVNFFELQKIVTI